jgi:hypothetical protein
MLLVSRSKSESAITTTSWNADCSSSNNLSSIHVLATSTCSKRSCRPLCGFIEFKKRYELTEAFSLSAVVCL